MEFTENEDYGFIDRSKDAQIIRRALHERQLQDALQAFNAPFLSVFAALIPHGPGRNAFKEAKKVVSALNKGLPAAEQCKTPTSSKFEKTINGEWSITWHSNSGREYKFGTDAATKAYSIRYPADSALAGDFDAITA